MPEKIPSRPQLPPEFLLKLSNDPMMTAYSSAACLPEFHKYRFDLVDPVLRRQPAGSKTQQSVAKMGEVLLHTTILLADPIMLCEAIRLGASPEARFPTCNTPLHEGLGQLTLVLACEQPSSHRERKAGRLIYHSDVGRTAHGDQSISANKAYQQPVPAYHWALLHATSFRLPSSKVGFGGALT